MDHHWSTSVPRPHSSSFRGSILRGACVPFRLRQMLGEYTDPTLLRLRSVSAKCVAIWVMVNVPCLTYGLRRASDWHCFAIIIGFLSSSVLSTSCAWLFIVDCTAKHHVIWPTSSHRLPQRPPYSPRLAVSHYTHTTSSLSDRSFSVAAPRAWNILRSPLRRVDSVDIFRRQLKTVFLLRLFQIFQLF